MNIHRYRRRGQSAAKLGSNPLKVQRLSRKGVAQETGRSATHPSHSDLDDDIVRPREKSQDTCNQFVAGSSPAAGAIY